MMRPQRAPGDRRKASAGRRRATHYAASDNYYIAVPDDLVGIVGLMQFKPSTGARLRELAQQLCAGTRRCPRGNGS
jgi:hypothetical protein